MDPVFQGVGKKEGLVAWRIEKLQPVRVADDKLRKLYSGDSYIFLKTVQKNNSLTWNIHFWLGKDTSQDESGVAAYKTVELDESLGGGPVQYRECQGHESDLFMSYFKATGLEYLEGGVASGFKTVVKDQYDTILFQVKGKRTVRVNQVPCKNSSLTIDDVYVLDMGLQIFVFNGKKANRQEKAKGLDFVKQLNNNERGGRAQIVLIDDEPKNVEFWKVLGGYVDVTKEGVDDEAFDSKNAVQTKLIKLSDSSSTLQTTDITPKDGVLTKQHLSSEDVFIVDTGNAIFVWIGKQASSEEKKNGMIYATKYLSAHKRPLTTPITRVMENTENSTFKSLFKQWDPPRVLNFNQTVPTQKTPTGQPIDVKGIYSNQSEGAEEDDFFKGQKGTNKITAWRIEDMEKVLLENSTLGEYYGGDSYIIFNTFTPENNSKPQHVIYYWQGRTSSQDERGAAALWATSLDNEMGGSPVQVRVIQGKEPGHFRHLFKGKLIVHSGGKASGFKNSTEKDSYDRDGVSLFHIKGTNENNTMASQVEEKASCLNSGDCFVLVTPEKVYLWDGQGSSRSEQNVAKNIANILSRNKVPVEEVNEGNESDAFWGYLGGKAEYPQFSAGIETAHEARLFQCSNSSGHFLMSEIHNFSQDDLNVDDVFLLDTYTSIFVWIGSGANKLEKKNSLEVAHQYLQSAKSDGRGDDTTIMQVQCNNEPLLFTCHFLAWDPKLFEEQTFVDPYEARLFKLRKEQESKQAKDLPGTITSNNVAPSAPVTAQFKSQNDKFSYEQLINGVDGIDMASKENYLSDVDFAKMFKVTRAEFDKLPKWKQQAKKKELKLF